MLITQEMLETLKLSENFTAAELCASQMAEAKGIENIPKMAQLLNLAMVTRMCLQPVRDNYAYPIPKYSGISSGFRSSPLNRLVGSESTSDHLDGKAVDFQVPGISNFAVAKWMAANLSFDQLILEKHGNGEVPNKGWIHVSYRGLNTNRNEVLTFDGKKYKEGLKHYWGAGL